MRTAETSPSHVMGVAWLLGTLCLATLTLWIPAYWPVALFEISIFLLAGATLLRQRDAVEHSFVPLYVFAFLALWGVVQCLTGSTVNRFVTERALCQWMAWAAFYFAATSVFGDRGLAAQVRRWLVWFGCALAVEAILQAYLSPGIAFGLFPTGYQQYVMGPIVYHTHYAVLVETILPIAFYLGLCESRGVYLGASAVLLASLVVSASRGGLLLAGLELVAVAVLWQLQKRKQKPRPIRRLARRLAVLTGLTAVLAIIVGYETASQRFATEALMAGRLQFALSTLRMIRVHPWMGWGLGSWPSVYPAFATFDAGARVNQAHTDWLQWTAEGGLPAGMAMLWLTAWAVKPTLRTIWGIGVLAVLLHATFDYPFSRPAVGAWPILILALVAVDQNAQPEQSALETLSHK